MNDPKYKALSPANKTKLQNRVKGEILGRPTPSTSKSPSTVKRGRRGTGRFTPRRSQQSRAPRPATRAPRPAPAAPEKTWAGKAQGRPDPTPSVAPKGFGSQAEAKGKVPFKTKYGTVWRKPSNPPGSAPKGFTRSQVPASRGYYNVKPKSTAPAPKPAGAPGLQGSKGKSGKHWSEGGLEKYGKYQGGRSSTPGAAAERTRTQSAAHGRGPGFSDKFRNQLFSKPATSTPDPGPVGAPGAPGAPGDEEGFDATAKRYLKKKKTKK